MAGNEFSLKEDVAVVAGYGSGWLIDVALGLAEVGAKVVITGGVESAISAAASAVQQAGGRALAVPADLETEKGVAQMAEEVLKDMGHVDVLINAFNLELWKPLFEMTVEEWDRVCHANLAANFLCTREIGKHMASRKKGSIVNVISGLAERGAPNGVAYCATMGGVLQMTRALALEMADLDVRVNAVGVGWLERDAMTEGKDVLAGYIPMRRRAAPRDIIPLIVFLASGASSYLSGNMYTVDGGLMARG